MVEKAFKYRIYPNDEQKVFLSKQFGSVRFVYNHFLNERKTEYLNNKKNLNYYDNAKSLTILKQQEDVSWLNEINSQSLQASLRNLEVAYTRFFQKKSKFPQFKKKENDQCVKIPQHFSIENDLLFIPKLKSGIKINLHRPIYGKMMCCFIRKTTTDKYYVSVLCETDVEKLKPSNNQIGIDVGIKNLISTSSGELVENIKTIKKYEKQLAYQQRQYSKKKKGSNKQKKVRKRIALIHEKIKNVRLDHLHKISKKLINENQVIISETLSVANMMKNHNLAKVIADCSWGELFRQLKYKANWYGRTYYQIDKFFPSSKMCNNCKFIIDDLPLKIREWDCPNCNSHNDRDINAAKNIKEKGLINLGIWDKSLNQKPEEALSLERSLSREAPAFMRE